MAEQLPAYLPVPPLDAAELQRLHDCFLASVYGNSDETAERILGVVGTTVDDFVRSAMRGLVIVSPQYVPGSDLADLHYLILLRAEATPADGIIYKVITVAHWSQILTMPEDLEEAE